MEYLVAIDEFDGFVHHTKQSLFAPDQITVPTAEFDTRVERIRAAATELLAKEAQDVERPVAQAISNLAAMSAGAGKRLKVQKMDVYDQLDTLRERGVDVLRRIRADRALSFDIETAPELDALVREIAGGGNLINLLRAGEVVAAVTVPGEPTQYPG